jgi:hypothetical protein
LTNLRKESGKDNVRTAEETNQLDDSLLFINRLGEWLDHFFKEQHLSLKHVKNLLLSSLLIHFGDYLIKHRRQDDS